MWIARSLEAELRQLAQQRPVLVLTGARQTGKTSLVRHLFPSLRFVSLDLPSEADQAERDPAAFLARHPPPLAVDEVQYAPGLFRHLKARVDAARATPGQFVLTGSQKLSLMQAVSDSLAGRAAVIELEGLTVRELAGAVARPDPVELAVRGTLPELWASPEIDRVRYYQSYLATYLERDVRQMLNVGSLRDFERFLRACALRSAQLLNKAELARDVGISPSTAAQWLSVLLASNQVSLLEPWFSNATKSLTKSPKLYVTDTGLLCTLLGIGSAAELRSSPFAGAVWETLVAGELRRQIAYRERPGDLYFWRDRAREVDFVIHRGGRFELYDAKWTEYPSDGDAKPLLRVAAELPADSVMARGLISRTPNAYPLASGATAVPLGELPPPEPVA